jgi:hypothetical protein
MANAVDAEEHGGDAEAVEPQQVPEERAGIGWGGEEGLGSRTEMRAQPPCSRGLRQLQGGLETLVDPLHDRGGEGAEFPQDLPLVECQ